MRIDAISSRQQNTNFNGAGSKIGKIFEGAAATLQTKTNQNRKTISIELHNSLVKLTAYRVGLLMLGASGLLGYKIGDNIADNNTEDLADAIQMSNIDTNAPFEIKDANHDGSVDMVFKNANGETVIMDIKNSNLLMESTGYREVK